ncbi:hypothetical protein JB92DRAFT_2910960 [Gautieria morchelliformis]|nr:hypothetical protein JB92DRAFT_2910960 [Gautieria morchelliformis]
MFEHDHLCPSWHYPARSLSFRLFYRGLLKPCFKIAYVLIYYLLFSRVVDFLLYTISALACLPLSVNLAIVRTFFPVVYPSVSCRAIYVRANVCAILLSGSASLFPRSPSVITIHSCLWLLTFYRDVPHITYFTVRKAQFESVAKKLVSLSPSLVLVRFWMY